MMREELISSISWSYVRSYAKTDISLFRQYQNAFLEKYGGSAYGRIVELGCEKHYSYARYFPNAQHYDCTNIARKYNTYLDVTDMASTADCTQDTYICVSVLEHVPDIQSALREIYRTLKVGGTLFLTIPFLFPVHDEADFWRLSKTAYIRFFDGYRVTTLVHFGGKYATVANLMQRPKGRLSPRYWPQKLIGWMMLLCAKYFDRIDDSPIGFGIIAEKIGDARTI